MERYPRYIDKGHYRGNIVFRKYKFKDDEYLFLQNNRIISRHPTEEEAKQALIQKNITDGTVKNKMRIKEDGTVVVYYKYDNNDTYEFYVSVEDIDLIDNYVWVIRNDGYIFNNKINLLHRAIMKRILNRNLVRGYVVDHINHQRYDNTRTNLRYILHTDNLKNLPGKNYVIYDNCVIVSYTVGPRQYTQKKFSFKKGKLFAELRAALLRREIERFNDQYKHLFEHKYQRLNELMAN